MLASILILDDDHEICQLFQAGFKHENFSADIAHNLNEAKSLLKSNKYDGVLTDIYLDNEDGLNSLQELIRLSPSTRFFCFTSKESIHLAVEAMENGAANFFPKALGYSKIIELVKSKLTIEAESEGQCLENLDLIGKSPEMLSVFNRISQFSKVDSTLLITGESGTGKEVVARALHKLSPRKDGPFEAINCGAIPENLLESELFGHKKGAFTDAKTDKKGLFEVCNNGVLMLDEIGDMPLALQVKMLRVLQEKEVRPLGSNHSIKVNPKIIACTHRDLAQLVKDGQFRQDLLYRLSVLRLHIPPLRERDEDIPVLANYFIEEFNKRFNKQIMPLSNELIVRFRSYPWPGNVRELQNSIERAVVLATGNQLNICDIFYNEDTEDKPQTSGHQAPSLIHNLAKKDFEKNYIKHLMQESEGNISKAARMSGKHRVEIYRLMEKYNFQRQDFTK
jgi:two-component system, NtrC family, response regulator GlrR